MSRGKPELLLPAGSAKRMRYAFAYGADAVYAGHPRYSLRMRNNEFGGSDSLVALRTFLRDMQEIFEAEPDGLIVADPGLVLLLHEHAPRIAVRSWQKTGIRRVILSRELELSEIAEIRHQCPVVELETFVRGALCIAHSGRRLLSGYMNHRDANQGSCRRFRSPRRFLRANYDLDCSRDSREAEEIAKFQIP